MNREEILLRRYYLLDKGSSSNGKFYSAKLLNTFGVLVDRPTRVKKEHVEMISEFYGKMIPNSFYSNPQDTKYFTCGELLLEQLVSYLSIELITGVNSTDESSFDRIEIFKKALPNYKEGSEVVFRNYKVVKQEEADKILEEVVENLASYTRKWSETEQEEFVELYKDYYKGQYLHSKDNGIAMFKLYQLPVFAKALDQKDVVKLSVEMKGENKKISYTNDEFKLLQVAVLNCQKAKLTKKQAKYFNTISKYILLKKGHETNISSPHKQAKALLRVGDVVGAAKIYAANGSLLERNISWLLSRANYKQAVEILDLIKVSNPLVAIQFVNSLITEDTSQPRVFKFTRNRRVMKHVETDKEFEFRKSKLSDSNKALLKEVFNKKVDEYYRALPSLGKVYISDAFKKIALPLNTSANGSGLDILPTGSRLPITDDYIRAFCYWRNAYDIDTSVNFSKGDERVDTLYWGSYSSKMFGHSALASGDDRSANGAEYIDFRISELKALGYKYAVYSLNGFNSDLNDGEIYCGYQNKKDLNTTAWSPKNMAIKIHVKGDSRSFMGFAIDLVTNEVVILNQMLESDYRVVNASEMSSISVYLDPKYLADFNVYRIASLRGEVVTNPEDADVVFDNDYTGPKKTVKSTDVEKIVNLLK